MPQASRVPVTLRDAVQASLKLTETAVTTTANSVHITWRANSHALFAGRQFQILVVERNASGGFVVGRGCVETEGEQASIRCFFLPSEQDFVAIIANLGAPGAACAFPFRTRAAPAVDGLPPTIYIGPEHLPLGRAQLVAAPSEYLWTDCWDAGFWHVLFRASLFCLPSHTRECVLVPNPRLRFVVQLDPAPCGPRANGTTPTPARAPLTEGIAGHDAISMLDEVTHPPLAPRAADHISPLGAGHWRRSSKLRKHKGTFALSIDRDFAGALAATARHHEEHKGSTWLTQECVAMLVRAHDDPVMSRDVRWAVFELWDAATGALVAVSIGFARGRAFHDVTACTFARDHRSAGRVLLRVQGELLERAGYALWYLGFQVDYMTELSKHGGCQLGRLPFLQLWDECQQPCAAHEHAPHDHWANVLELVTNGRALVQTRQDAHSQGFGQPAVRSA